MAEAIIALKNIYSKNRNILLVITKILVSTGLIIYIINSVNIGNIILALSGADKVFIISAFGLSAFNILLQYLKWKLVCNSLLAEGNNRKIMYSLFYGLSAGSFTPGRIGEYFGRAIPFTDKPLGQITSGVIIDKLFSLCTVLFFGSITFLLYLDFSVTYTATFVMIITLVTYSLYKVIRSRISASQIGWVQKFNMGFNSLKGIDNKFIYKITILSVLFYCCFIIQYALLVCAFSLHYEITNFIWAGNLVMFVKTFIPPVSFGELGIREGVSVYFIKRFGESAAAGFNASLFLFIINILFPALIGLVFLLKRK